jgi:hypothetical protein
VYAFAVDGFLPHLRSLRVQMRESNIVSVSGSLPVVTSLRMPHLERFDLYANRLDRKVEWTKIEALTTADVMPRLRQCSLVYDLLSSSDIRHIFASPLFDNDERHVRVRFMLRLRAQIPANSAEAHYISEMRSARYNEISVEHVSSSCRIPWRYTP